MTRFESHHRVLAHPAAFLLLGLLAPLASARPICDPPCEETCPLPIPIESIPYVIDEPGTYCLVEDLQLDEGEEGAIGIEILTEGVILDLNGFRLDGNDVGSTGIQNAFHWFTTVRNGTVQGWERGIQLHQFCTVEDVAIRTSFADDLETGITTSNQCTIRRCRVLGTSVVGISAGANSLVEDCNFSGGAIGISGSVVQVYRCTFRGLSGAAVDVTRNSHVVDCQVFNGDGDAFVLGSGSRASGLTAKEIGGRGLATGASCVVESSTFVECGGESGAVRLGTGSLLRSSTVRQSSTGVVANSSTRIEDCLITLSNGPGIDASGSHYVVIANTTVQESNGDGVILDNRSEIRGCMVAESLGSGVRLLGDRNRVERNQLLDAATGITVLGEDNLITRNGLAGNGSDYSVPYDNQLGRFLNGSWWIPSDNPWANFALDYF